MKILSLPVLAALLSSVAHAVESPEITLSHSEEEMWRMRGIPIAFNSDNMDFSYGAAGVSLSAGQPQAALFASALGSTNDSKGFAFGAFNYLLPFLPNVYWSADTIQWDITEYQYYTNASEGYHVRDMDSSIETLPLENRARRSRLFARYVIPIGDGERAAQDLNTRNFIPERAQEINGWSPWTSGVTSLRLMFEDSARTFSEESEDPTKTGASIVRLRGMWDNTDSWLIPDKGARFQAEYSWGDGKYQDNNWQFWSAQASGFIGFNNFEGWTRQQVLAMNLWMADTPSWDEGNRPPDYLGAALGGLMRLRGYDAYRFYDQSAWVYQLEYRVIPTWQPITNLASKIDIRVPWWQFALFADAGAVASSFDVSAFHRDLKWTAGAGMRIFVEGIVLRFDLGFSEEDSSIAFMIDQPF